MQMAAVLDFEEKAIPSGVVCRSRLEFSPGRIPDFKSVVKSFGDQNMSSEVYVLGEVSSKVVLGAVAMLCIAVVGAAGLVRSGLLLCLSQVTEVSWRLKCKKERK